MGDWTNAPGSASDVRKNMQSMSGGQQNKGGISSQNNALSSAISSGLNGVGGSAFKTNMTSEEVFLNSIKSNNNANLAMRDLNTTGGGAS